jgi:hypothetical protein
MHAFRAAVESSEFDTIGTIFTEDAVLHSPIAHRPYRGREMIAAIICAVAEVLEDFRFKKEIGAGEADNTIGDRALMFTASVSDLDIQGCDFLHTREDGLIDEVTVMLRPLKAVAVFAERMREELGKAMVRKGATAAAEEQ